MTIEKAEAMLSKDCSGLIWNGYNFTFPIDYPIDVAYTIARVAHSAADPRSLLAEIEEEYQDSPSNTSPDDCPNGYRQAFGGTDGWNAMDIAVWREIVRVITEGC